MIRATLEVELTAQQLGRAIRYILAALFMFHS
jgi:hypothetical protein